MRRWFSEESVRFQHGENPEHAIIVPRHDLGALILLTEWHDAIHRGFSGEREFRVPGSREFSAVKIMGPSGTSGGGS